MPLAKAIKSVTAAATEAITTGVPLRSKARIIKTVPNVSMQDPVAMRENLEKRIPSFHRTECVRKRLGVARENKNAAIASKTMEKLMENQSQ